MRTVGFTKLLIPTGCCAEIWQIDQSSRSIVLKMRHSKKNLNISKSPEQVGVNDP
jgi:hypothetical protein